MFELHTNTLGKKKNYNKKKEEKIKKKIFKKISDFIPTIL